MANIDTIVWDADNTLWSWMEFAVPAYERMIKDLARISGKTEEEARAALQGHIAGSDSIENEGVVQTLERKGFFAHIRDFDQTAVILDVQAGFEEARAEHFTVYDGIRDVMAHVRERGLRQLIVTDAPGNQALSRLVRSGLYEFIEAVHAMPSADIDVPEALREKSRQEKARPNVPPLHVLQEEKPHTPLEQVVGMTREEITRRVAVIGDNESKDMALARIYECIGIHAKYGAASKDLIDRIRRIAPPQSVRRNAELTQAETPMKPSRIFPVNSPHEIIRTLFGESDR